QVVALVALFVGTAIRRTERGLIDALEAKGAVTPENAVELPLSNWLKQQLFRRLQNGGAVGETAEQKRYLKVEGYAAYRHRRRMRALVVITVVAALGVYFYLRSPHP
ncbi:MAG TPA: hypothetical protein VL295_09660, partial [Gemmatimonadales bacterium]|nr:hypothetical protein [Gemmatimonadales bacterium]